MYGLDGYPAATPLFRPCSRRMRASSLRNGPAAEKRRIWTIPAVRSDSFTVTQLLCIRPIPFQ